MALVNKLEKFYPQIIHFSLNNIEVKQSRAGDNSVKKRLHSDSIFAKHVWINDLLMILQFLNENNSEFQYMLLQLFLHAMFKNNNMQWKLFTLKALQASKEEHWISPKARAEANFTSDGMLTEQRISTNMKIMTRAKSSANKDRHPQAKREAFIWSYFIWNVLESHKTTVLIQWEHTSKTWFDLKLDMIIFCTSALSYVNGAQQPKRRNDNALALTSPLLNTSNSLFNISK